VHAYDIRQFLLSQERTYSNLFDAHPPFRIDRKFGGASRIAETLMQWDAGKIARTPCGAEFVFRGDDLRPAVR
jgi:alpha-L-fucosidase 2